MRTKCACVLVPNGRVTVWARRMHTASLCSYRYAFSDFCRWGENIGDFQSRMKDARFPPTGCKALLRSKSLSVDAASAYDVIVSASRRYILAPICCRTLGEVHRLTLTISTETAEMSMSKNTFCERHATRPQSSRRCSSASPTDVDAKI